MSCCAPGAEFTADAACAPPMDEELLLASRQLGDDIRQVELAVPAVHCGACIQTIEQRGGLLKGGHEGLSILEHDVLLSEHDGFCWNQQDPESCSPTQRDEPDSAF